MSQAELPNPLAESMAGSPGPAARLERVLLAATRRWRSARLLTVALTGVAVWIATLLLAVALDAALGLPAAGLLAIHGGLLAIALAVVVKLWRTAQRTRHDARRAAVAMERRGGVAPSRLINALELAETSDAPQRMSPALRGLAVEQGDAAAARLDDAALIDRPARKRAALSAGGAVLVFVASWLTLPGVFDAVGARLLSPLSDLPPYTTLRFEVAVGPEVIHVGKPGVVEVTLSRGLGGRSLPEQADLVVVTADGPAPPSPMHRSFREGDVVPPPAHATAAQLAALPAPPTRFSLRFERLDEPVEFYIDTPDGRSALFTIDVETTPLFESLHATVTPPDYAGRAAETRRLEVDKAGAEDRVVRALRGSAVTFTAGSNVPLAKSHLARGAQSRAIITDHPGQGPTVETLLIVDVSTTATLQLVGVDGKASAVLPITIEALDDAPPTVSILSPEPLAFAVEGYPVPIRIVARDDVNLASMKLHLSVDGRDAPPIELIAPAGPGIEPLVRFNTTHELDPAALGLAPGDTLRYFATARDGLPFALGGPPHDTGQLAETAVHQIQIISQAEWQEMARLEYGLDQLQAEVEAYQAEMAKLAEARAEIVEQLAALQQQLESGEPMTDLQRQQMQDLQEQLEGFAEDARELADAMRERAEVPWLYEFEEPFKQRLRELAEQLENQAEMAEATEEALEPMAGAEPGQEPGEAKPSSPGSPLRGVTPTQVEEFLEQAQQLAEENEPFDEATQQEMEAFEEDLMRLELAEEMLFHAERIRAVIVEQRDLERKLGELRFRAEDELSAEEAERMTAYGERQFELRDELEDAALMLRESAELAGPLLPTMSSTSVMLTEQLDRLLVYEDMELAGERAEGLDGGLAHASAQVAADKLESLLSDVGSMPGQAEADLDACLTLPKANLQRALEQMSGARAAAAAMGMMQGGQGRGTSGSSGGRANASVIGPRSMGSGSANSGAGEDATGRSSRASAADGLVPELGEAETLNPDSAETRSRAAIALPGVPARYRDVAAAYFQRLADEAARQDDP